MTIPATPRRAGPFTGNDSTTAFPFTFRVFTTADVRVVLADASGAEADLVLDSDYSVSLNLDQDASPGGTITYPVSGDPLATGEALAIVGALENEQTLDLPGGGSFSPTALENALDRAVIQIQQLAEENNRGIRLPVSSSGSGQLPADLADKLLSFDTNGNPVMVAPASGSATALAIELASNANATNGAGMIGYADGLAYVAGTVGAVLNGFAQVLIPLTTSMTAQERADMINAYAIDYAGKATLVIPVHPSGPTVLWTIEEEIKLPGYSHIRPQIWRCAGLKLSDTALVGQNVITNASNDQLEHTTQDQVILVEGLRIDGNGSRAVAGTVGGNPTVIGIGIGFAGVKWGIVRGNLIYGGFRKHCIDFSASIYNLGMGGTTGDDSYPDGPSEFCAAYENDCQDSADDCITTHSSFDLWIERNVVRKLWSTSLDATNSNGIEIDEGSKRVLVKGNRVEGGQYMSRGIEVKGHSDTPCARDITVEDNWISNVVVGIAVRHIGHGDTAEPQSPNGFNVRVVRNRIWDIGIENGNTSVGSVTGKGIDIQSVDGVVVQDNVLLNENATFDTGGTVVQVYAGARNVRVEGNEIRGFDTADYAIRATSTCRGLVLATDNFIEDSGAVAAIYLNCDDVGTGDNRIVWNGAPSGTDVAVWLDATASVTLIKEPDYVDGYTAALKIGATVSALVEPLTYGNALTWATGPNQKMRLVENGDFVVGADASFAIGSGTDDGVCIAQDGLVRVSRNNQVPVTIRRRLGDGFAIGFYRDTTNVGNIAVTTTATAYNTSSDYRLKTNVSPADQAAAVAAVLSWPFKRYEFLAAPGVVECGVLAHELQAVKPSAVTGIKDGAEQQGVDYSKLVAEMAVALQYALTEIAALKAR